MERFKFRLQKVLDLRLWREQESALRLGEARRRYDEAESVLAALEAVRASSRERLMRVHGAGGSVGQLQNLDYVLAHLDARIAEADAARRDAERGVREWMDEYTAALRERRVLERLRDRHLEAARVLEAQVERRAMDDVAVSRHVRKTTDDAARGLPGW